jgi:uncharacterized protein DUF5925/ATPase family protein associated with various cellular activities (AAA)
MTDSRLDVIYESDSDFLNHAWVQRISEAGWTKLAFRKWETDETTLDLDARFCLRSPANTYWLIDNPMEGAAAVRLYSNGEAHVTSASVDMVSAESFIDIIQEKLLAREPRDDGTVPVRFWYMGARGPESVTRHLAAPVFDDIKGNYAKSVSKSLGRLTSDDFEPGKGGQLILWHGLPGTGKTWALRSLAREWAKWCRIDYVVDPEAFFGTAAYLMQMLLHEAPSYEDGQPKRGWRLIIFEDTGELLSADARERAGQGLSRLLNTVDGFLGQGLRTLILITTNEELTKLHPAVSRPGRAAATIAFTPLDKTARQAWCEANGIAIPVGEKSLAELFAIRNGYDRGEESRAFGFNAA